jgi:hypothetical protein
MLIRVDVDWAPADHLRVDDDPYMQPAESRPPAGLRPELLRVIRARRGEAPEATPVSREEFFQEVSRLLRERRAVWLPVRARRWPR